MDINGFSVHYRNYGHWDVYNVAGRLFRIRGGPGNYIIFDERYESEQKKPIYFKTVGACMAYICDDLMFELIVAEGQEPIVIESWNVK